MKFCPNCGTQLEDSAAFCTNCGSPVAAAPSVPAEPMYSYSDPYMPQQPARVETGGLIAWSIITLLLCTIPGIVALVKACNVNSCATSELQQQAVQSCKTWCIVGTVLGLIALIGTIALQLS